MLLLWQSYQGAQSLSAQQTSKPPAVTAADKMHKTGTEHVSHVSLRCQPPWRTP